MRVSTNLINMRAVNGMLDQQSKLSELQMQLSSGKRIQSPAVKGCETYIILWRIP